MDKHTPTPWKLAGDKIISSDEMVVVTKNVHKNDAAFIVRAVNIQEFLIKTLEEVGLQLERGSSTMAIQKTVREAIAKAEGK